ncbi:hypothetical protein HUE56_04420 (plasmid) [Azospirillum oryzae]|uniref:Uncharacterized protein n=1 Tax=Azospirillum oryzae TaxID=286727 RepID=A0A6N1ADN8_9PROT|nr:hypothetical protein [Azospirillum oryzae]KAA0585664.1 hypothetical protein FZ938_25385 [Azospirillum oryzae]QKS49785.1 hypothetical protein HUE56_04420 [Azospirillum oryzae]GLR79043.1 hypothetical protein GCM10007856_17170 [Azospirillum oryzae]
MATYREAREAISNFITVCEKAEDSAKGAEQTALLQLIDDLRAERMRIDAAELKNSGKAYPGLTEEIRSAKKKLADLSDGVKRIINAAEVATQLIGTLTRIVTVLAGI